MSEPMTDAQLDEIEAIAQNHIEFKIGTIFARRTMVELIAEVHRLRQALYLSELSRGVPRESMPSGSRWGIGPIYGLIDPDAVRRD